MVKFSELEKKEKIFRVINLVFMTLIFLACMGCAIYHGLTGNRENRLLTSIMTGLVTILPFVIELIIRRRFYNMVFFLYLFYVFVAGLIGSVFNVYYYVGWFDIFVHCVAGYVFALVGLLVLSLIDDYKKYNIWTIVIFCFAFTLATELVWELIEWAGDNLFGQFAQGYPPEGFDVPLVTDTMQDILCNFAGGVVFVIHYLIEKLSKHSLGINFIERELTFKRRPASVNVTEQGNDEKEAEKGQEKETENIDKQKKKSE